MIGHADDRAAMRWLLGGLAAVGLLERARAQDPQSVDSTQATSIELDCFNDGNGGSYFDTSAPDPGADRTGAAWALACIPCSAGRYDHDAIINMPQMNMDFTTGSANFGQITWWDSVNSLDYNPAGSPCLDCEPGKFAPFEGTTHMCYPCGVGQYSPGGPNLVGPVDAATSLATYVGCTACGAGTSDHDEDPATPCVACAVSTQSFLDQSSAGMAWISSERLLVIAGGDLCARGGAELPRLPGGLCRRGQRREHRVHDVQCRVLLGRVR